MQFAAPDIRACDYILWSMVPASGKKVQEGLLFRQIRPFGFGRNSPGLTCTRRAAKRREGEEMKFVFLLLLSRPSWKSFQKPSLDGPTKISRTHMRGGLDSVGFPCHV